MRRIIVVNLVLLVYILLLRLPILKTKVDENNFYYKDFLGFIHTRHSSCGWIGPCIYWDTPLIGVHSLTFHTIKYHGLDCLDTYAKTKSAVYYLGEKQNQIVDPPTFELLNNSYAKDSKNVYELCDLKVMNEIVSDNFQIVGSVCSKSNTSVYCFKREVEGADAETFNHVWRGYYKDKNHVYHLGMALEGIDPNTFATLSWGYIKDGNNIYYFDEDRKELTKLINVKTNGFEVLTKGYAKDTNQVFLKGEILPNTTPDDFVVPLK